MSRKVLILNRVEGSVTYGRVVKTTEHMAMQDYAHEHVEMVVRDKLMRNATATEVTGFALTLTAGTLGFSIAEGHVIDVLGRSFNTLPPGQATALAVPQAHASLPRIDLVYASLAADQDAVNADLPFRRLRTTVELADPTSTPYPITNYNVATQRQNAAVVTVRQGVANASPVAPAVGANEVALFQIRVDAGATSLALNKVTDVRPTMKSLPDAFSRIVALEASPAVSGLAEAVQDVVGAFIGVAANNGLAVTYDDTANTLVFSSVVASGAAKGMMSAVDFVKLGNLPAFALADFDNRYVNATGDTINGNVVHNGVYSQTNLGGTDAFQAINATHRIVGAQNLQNVPSAGLTVYQQTGVFDNDIAYGVMIHANGNRALNRNNTQSIALYTEVGGSQSTLKKAGMFNGDVQVLGAFTATSKNFVFDHPLDPFNKILVYGVVEMPGHGLLFPVQVTLVGGAAEVSLDEIVGQMQGTLKRTGQRLMVMSVYSEGAARVAASLNEETPVGEETKVMLSLESDDAADTSTVNVLIVGHRADDCIKAAPYVDEDGLLVVEQDKPSLSEVQAGRLEPLVIEVPSDSPLVGESLTVTVPDVIGKKGFPLNPDIVAGATSPTRELSYVAEFTGESAGPNFAGSAAQAVPGTIWNDLANVTGADDGLKAEPAAATISARRIDFTGFGFAVPTGKVIVGVKVETKVCAENGGGEGAVWQLLVGGAPVGDPKTPGLGLPRALTWRATGASDDTWGAALTPADINDAGWGFRFNVLSSEADTFQVDAARITVYFDDAP